MDVISDSELNKDSDKLKVEYPDSIKGDFVRDVYLSVDKTVKQELNRLFVEEDIVASCKEGCFYCCGQNILTSIEEARALTNYIKHTFSQKQIDDLRIRTQGWHVWNKTRQNRQYVNRIGNPHKESDILYCPLLVDGKCSAYAMRPLICQTHFVSSDPQACRTFNDPEAVEDQAVALTSVLEATGSLSNRLRVHTESSGLNFNGSIMLLPHWLAIEMNWDFAIELKFE